jgi:hypothetical protein
MSQERRDQVMSYFVMRWETCRGIRYHASTAILPTTLKAEVCYALYIDVVGKVWKWQMAGFIEIIDAVMGA